jgi:hypothetical protein
MCSNGFFFENQIKQQKVTLTKICMRILGFYCCCPPPPDFIYALYKSISFINKAHFINAPISSHIILGDAQQI